MGILFIWGWEGDAPEVPQVNSVILVQMCLPGQKWSLGYSHSYISHLSWIGLICSFEWLYLIHFVLHSFFLNHPHTTLLVMTSRLWWSPKKREEHQHTWPSLYTRPCWCAGQAVETASVDKHSVVRENMRWGLGSTVCSLHTRNTFISKAYPRWLARRGNFNPESLCQHGPQAATNTWIGVLTQMNFISKSGLIKGDFNALYWHSTHDWFFSPP